MKTKIALVSLLVSLSVGQAQVTNSSSLLEDISNGLGSISNWVVSPYATYADSAPKHFGGGIIALYNFNQYVGTGPGVDWLGEFNLVSANVTLRVPTHPLSFIGLSNIVATPFIITGIATPLGGAGKANGNVSSVEGVGLALDIFKAKSINFGLGYSYVNWTGAGDFSGRHHEIFLKFSKGF